MADIEAAAPAPAPPQLAAPPACRSAAARMVSALTRFLSLASDLAICFVLSASWTCSLALAATIAAHWAFGAASPATAVVEEFFHMTIYAVSLLFVVAFVLAMALMLHSFVLMALLQLQHWRHRSRVSEAAAQAGGDAGAMIILATLRDFDQEEAGEEGDGLDGDCGLATIVVLLMAMGVGVLMVIFAPARGSWEEWLGTKLFDVGFFLVSLTYCYLVFPSFATKVIDEWDVVRKNTALLTSLYLIG